MDEEKPSNLTVEILETMTVEHLTALRTDELRILYKQIQAENARAKKRSEIFSAVVRRKYDQQVTEQLKRVKKDSGTVHVIEDGIDIAATRAKEVEWDQVELRKALDAMTREDRDHYAKVELGIHEKKYLEAPDRIKEALKDARKVIPKKTTFEFKDVKPS
jgi:hypothetical protein